MTTYAESMVEYDRLQTRLAEASHALRSIPGIGSGPMGLTPDHVKADPAFRAAKRAYDVAHETCRSFNKDHSRIFKRELAAHRDGRRHGMTRHMEPAPPKGATPSVLDAYGMGFAEGRRRAGERQGDAVNDAGEAPCAA